MPMTQNPQAYLDSQLYLAAGTGDFHNAEMALEYGADINSLSQGETPLIMAVKNKQTEMVEFLLSRGADVNAQNKKGDTALMSASTSSDFDLMKILLDHHADPNIRSNDEQTALITCFKREGIKMLLDAGADIEAKDNIGNTVLIQACHFGLANDAVKFLVNCGANVNAKNNFGYTPLMVSAEMGYADNVKLLLESGANIYEKTEEGDDAILLARHQSERSKDRKAILNILESWIEMDNQNKALDSVIQSDDVATEIEF